MQIKYSSRNTKLEKTTHQIFIEFLDYFFKKEKNLAHYDTFTSVQQKVEAIRKKGRNLGAKN